MRIKMNYSEATKSAAILITMATLALSGCVAAQAQPVEVSVSVTNPLWTISRYLTGGHFVYAHEKDSIYADGRVADWFRSVRPGTFRFPGGTVVQFWRWDDPTGVFVGDNWDPTWDTNNNAPPDQWMSLDEYLAFCRRSGAEPMVGVNINSGARFDRIADSVLSASNCVQYCLNQGYRVKWWYLGNEENISADIVKAYAPALRAVDPDIKIIININNPTKAWLQTILQNDDGHVDVLETHQKWLAWQQPGPYATWLNQTPIFDGDQTTKLNQIRQWAREVGRTNLIVANNEWGLTSSMTNFNKYTRSLVAVDYLLEIFRGGWDMACLWNNQWPGQAEIHLMNSTAGYAFNPMARGFELLSSALEEQMLTLTTSLPNVYGFACRNLEGTRVQVYLINKTESSQSLNVRLGVFPADTNAPGALCMQSPGDNLAVLPVTYNTASNCFTTVLPALSFTRLAFPVATPAATTTNTLRVGDLGQPNSSTNLGTRATLNDTRLVAPSGGTLVVDSSSQSYPPLGIAGGLGDLTFDGNELLTIWYGGPVRISSLLLTAFGPSDNEVLVNGLQSDPWGQMANGYSRFDGHTLSLTATNFANLARVDFSARPVAEYLTLSTPRVGPGGGGVGLAEIQFAAGPRTLYREDFRNPALLATAPLSTYGWSDWSATSTNDPSSVILTNVTATQLGSSNLATNVVVASGVSFRGLGSNLFVGSGALGVAGGFSDATVNGSEAIELTLLAPGTLQSLALSGFGINDSPVTITGFSGNPGAQLQNGSATYEAAQGKVTLTATNYSAEANVNFTNPVAGQEPFSLQSLTTNAGAGGVGLISLSFWTESVQETDGHVIVPAGFSVHDPGSDTSAAVINFADNSEPVDSETKAITTVGSPISVYPAQFSELTLNWQQRGAVGTSNVMVSPMLNVGGLWLVSTNRFPVREEITTSWPVTFAWNSAASAWKQVSLSKNRATLGSSPASDLSGAIQGVGFYLDFSTAHAATEMVCLDAVTLTGIPLVEVQRGLRVELTNLDTVNQRATLKWNSYPGASYDVQTSATLPNWTDAQTNVPAQGLTTTVTATNPANDGTRLFRITERIP